MNKFLYREMYIQVYFLILSRIICSKHASSIFHVILYGKFWFFWVQVRFGNDTLTVLSRFRPGPAATQLVMTKKIRTPSK